MTGFRATARHLFLACIFLWVAEPVLRAQERPRLDARIYITYMETADSSRARRGRPASRRFPKREENSAELPSLLHAFQAQCPEVTITEMEETAAYFLTVTRTRAGGVLTRRYSVILTRSSGEVLYAGTVRRFSKAAKAACKIIGEDARKAPPRTEKPAGH